MITEQTKENAIISEIVEEDGVIYKYEIRRFDENDVTSFDVILYEIFVEAIIENTRGFYRSGGIFTNLEKAALFLKKLKDLRATPQNLPYVIEDAITV